MEAILYARNIQDLLTQLKNNQGLEVVGGCTKIENYPHKIISTLGIKELSMINRHERFIDIGPGTTLSEIIKIGENHMPQVLYEALNCIATPLIRNIATIGGNICSEGHKLTLYAPLLALDTKLEFTSLSETYYEPLMLFKKIPDGFVLTNIRIPIPDADISIFRRIGPEHKITQHSSSFAFLANTENNMLQDVNLAFAGPFAFRSIELENSLIGYRLPLSSKEIEQILLKVENEFKRASIDKMISPVVTQQFLNLTRYSFEQLT